MIICTDCPWPMVFSYCFPTHASCLKSNYKFYSFYAGFVDEKRVRLLWGVWFIYSSQNIWKIEQFSSWEPPLMCCLCKGLLCSLLVCFYIFYDKCHRRYQFHLCFRLIITSSPFQLKKIKHYCGICKKIRNPSDSGTWVCQLHLSMHFYWSYDCQCFLL